MQITQSLTEQQNEKEKKERAKRLCERPPLLKG